MATINFLYRSARNEAPLNLRLLFTHDEKAHVIGGKTKTIVSNDYWNNHHNKQRINDIDLKNKQTEIKTELLKLESFLLDEFEKADINEIDKVWLKNQIENYYNPVKAVKIPNGLIPFIEHYLTEKSNELTDNRIRKINVIKSKLERFEKSIDKQFKIIEINNNFKKLFIDYCKEEHYSINTISGDLAVLKTICKYAYQCDIETHKQLENLKLKEVETEAVYLSFDELEKIKALDLLSNERLNNVRNWLLISCYTAQRISDFMRFNNSMIIEKDKKQLLSFTQQKTNKKVTIPFLTQAQEVINKNNGKFPRPLSHQKYNDYLKELCKLAGINEPTKGTVRRSIIESKKKSKNDYRNITGTFEKWELISSHVGRRSFATNFYGTVPTSVLIGITNHSTEKMFLKYIRKTETDTAIDAFKYFE
jgi:site-specific recombinase XerD